MDRCKGRGASRPVSSVLSGGRRWWSGVGDEVGEGGRRVGGGVVLVVDSSCWLEADCC